MGKPLFSRKQLAQLVDLIDGLGVHWVPRMATMLKAAKAFRQARHAPHKRKGATHAK